jgi:quinol monooxygenase YgiN
MDKIFGIARFSVRPGQAPAFRQKAAECMAAARADLAGTGAYEWFMGENDSQCTVIEIYDGTEGMGRHIRQVGKIIPQLLEHATSEVTLLGDIDDAVMAKVAGKLNAAFAGRRLHGRLTGPAAPDGTLGANGIFTVARFRLQLGAAAGLKELAGRAFSAVVAKEPGTIAYEWFLSNDESEVTVIEIYRDTAAMLAHSGNAGTLMKDIMSVTEDRSVQLFGGLAGEARASYTARPGVSYVAPRLQGVL